METKTKVEKVTTTDFYESAYYLTCGARIEEIEIYYELKEEKIRMTLSGSNLSDAQRIYFSGNAYVHLLTFRRSYQHLRSAILQAKNSSKGSKI
jgi:hypothetical protein